MVQHIIETSTEAQGWIKQDEIHDFRVSHYQSLGYTIINNEIVPKNAFNGADDLTAQRTTLWDIPKETPDGTFEIQAPEDVIPILSGTETMDYGLYPRPNEWDDLDYDNDTLSARFDKTEFK